MKHLKKFENFDGSESAEPLRGPSPVETDFDQEEEFYSEEEPSEEFYDDEDPEGELDRIDYENLEGGEFNDPFKDDVFVEDELDTAEDDFNTEDEILDSEDHLSNARGDIDFAEDEIELAEDESDFIEDDIEDPEFQEEIQMERYRSPKSQRLYESKKHTGFKKVAKEIAKKGGYSKESADAILASKSRGSSTSAKRKNPRLKKVKG